MPIVLVVEDEASNFRLAEANLTKAGFKVERASDFSQVILLCGDPDFVKEISLVIVDLVLRSVDAGTDICRYLRSSRSTQNIPIFVLTSRHDSEARVEAYEAGANAFATKPYLPRDLVAVARKLTNAPSQGKPQGA